MQLLMGGLSTFFASIAFGMMVLGFTERGTVVAILAVFFAVQELIYTFKEERSSLRRNRDE